MIVRLVKLTFLPDFSEEFYRIYVEKESRIASWPGCSGVKLYQDVNHPAIYFTWSLWESEAHLNDYRHSAFFQETWAVVKKHFAAPPEARNLCQRS